MRAGQLQKVSGRAEPLSDWAAGAELPKIRSMIRPKRIVLVSALAALLGLSGCETVRTTSAGNVGVDRKQQMLVSSAEVDQAAGQAYDAELKTARDKGVLNTDRAQLERVTNVARRLVAATPA